MLGHIQNTRSGGVLLFCRDIIGVFYSSSWLDLVGFKWHVTHSWRCRFSKLQKSGVGKKAVTLLRWWMISTKTFFILPTTAPQNSHVYSGCYKFFLDRVFVAASHQTRLDTRSKARRPIKVGIKGRGRSGTSRDSNPACLCCSLAHLVQCEPDEASSFTNPNVGPGTYASLRLKLDAWSSAAQGGQKRQKCSSPTRR